MNLGQYFTTSPLLQDAVFELIQNAPSVILEPSMGRGDLIQHVSSKTPNTRFDCYEIDPSITFLEGKAEYNLTIGDFLTQQIDRKYDTIIGNPPYVKQKTRNLYVDFIARCSQLLSDTGELIMIVPSDVFKMTSSISVLSEMFATGCITDIVHPHDERLFKGATIDVIVFRYVKGGQMDTTGCLRYNRRSKSYYYNDFLYLFPLTTVFSTETIESMFSIHVGIVSGCESVFKNPIGDTDVITDISDISADRTITHKYMYLTDFPSDDSVITNYLLEHKKTLLKRRIRKFNESNWFEWGALRNIEIMRSRMGEPCIYMRNMTRKPIVAVEGTVGLFSGNITCLIPRTPDIPLDAAVNFFNSTMFKSNFEYAGRFRISHRQLSKCCYL